MILNATPTISNKVIPRRVNRALKSFLGLEEKYEEKIEHARAEAKKRETQREQKNALDTLYPQARVSLETFQITQARLNARYQYA